MGEGSLSPLLVSGCDCHAHEDELPERHLPWAAPYFSIGTERLKGVVMWATQLFHTHTMPVLLREEQASVPGPGLELKPVRT